jgi:hypothetical protein
LRDAKVIRLSKPKGYSGAFGDAPPLDLLYAKEKYMSETAGKNCQQKEPLLVTKTSANIQAFIKLMRKHPIRAVFVLGVLGAGGLFTPKEFSLFKSEPPALNPVSVNFWPAVRHAPHLRPGQSETVKPTVDSRIAAWQTSAQELGEGESALIELLPQTDDNQWWPYGRDSKRGACDGKGFPVHGDKNHILPGAYEGCLLVKFGDGSVQAFSPKVTAIRTSIPGPILFMMNDNATGTNKKFQGFNDNEGFLTVRLTISRPGNVLAKR